MAQFKIVLSTKDGKSYQREVSENEADYFMGKAIGETVSGDNFGLLGYECVITGGSDNAGFPMRKDVTGTGRKKILAVSGIGVKKKRHGQRQRKTVSGNTISLITAQINLKVVKEGKEKLGKEEAVSTEDTPKENSQ
jgi:small subunit ribosomal protein S6e